MNKGKEYKLFATGRWVISPSAQKIVDRIERKKKFRKKGQKKK